MFTRNLVRDILTFPAFSDATFALVDTNPKGLDFSYKAIKHIIEEGKYPAKVIATTDRKTVLPGADGVLCMLMAQPLEVFKHDLFICEKHGLNINVGDTRNPAGVFRFLRTIPVMLDILKDIRELCPETVFLNYTNPMAMLCRTMQEVAPDVILTGLCHSVQHTVEKFAKILDVPFEEINYTCAGINHMAFYTKLERKGKNLYPALHQATFKNENIYNDDIVRNEVFLATGYYVTESSGHFSEYAPWFRKREDLLDKYCYKGTSWNNGEKHLTVTLREERAKNFEKNLETFLAEPLDLKRGKEYAAYIYNAIFGDGTMYKFNGNVRNFGLIENLPYGACVEVPVLASPNGIEAIHVGDIPSAVLPLISLNSQIEEMVVRASLDDDPELIYQAMLYDPLASASLDLREIRNLVDDLFAFSKPYLPQFKKLK